MVVLLTFIRDQIAKIRHHQGNQALIVQHREESVQEKTARQKLIKSSLNMRVDSMTLNQKLKFCRST